MLKQPRRCHHTGRNAQAWEEEALDMILKAAFGERYEVLNEYRKDVGFFLACLGLMKFRDHADLIPNSDLLNLAAESRQQHKEAKQQ
jgi:hypothetical protein